MPAVNYEKPSIAAEDHPYQVVVSAARPGSPSDGDAIYETDTDKAYVWNGSSWVLTADASFLPDAASDDQTAAEVVFSPAGTIAANTVQAAIEEISADTTNLTASAVASVASGNLAATNVQTALNELQTELDTHDADHFTVCTAGGRPGSPGDGDMIYETDTDRVLVYNGTGWVIFGDGTLLSLNGSDVGIGTAPVAGNKLHVVDDVNGSLTGIRIDNADQSLKLQTYFEAGVAQYSSIESTNDPGNGGQDLALNPANGGNVGIGTTSPTRGLSIDAGTNSYMSFDEAGTETWVVGHEGGANDRFVVYGPASGRAYRLVVQGDGKVGIGNTTPRAALTVKRDVNTDGTPPAGDWAGEVFHASNASTKHGLLVMNNWMAVASTLFECGSMDASSGAYYQRFRVDGIGNTYFTTGTITSPATVLNTTAAAANMHIAASGLFYLSTSSRRYKTDIEDIDDAYADKVLAMRPVWYRSACDDDRQDHSHWGFIAEELDEIDKRLVTYSPIPILDDDGNPTYEQVPVLDDDGNQRFDNGDQLVERDADGEPITRPNAVEYTKIIPLLVNLVKRQDTRIATLETAIQELTARVEELEV